MTEEPFSCRWCNTPRREHGQRWSAAWGMHGWHQPPQWLILARMKLRRAAR